MNPVGAASTELKTGDDKPRIFSDAIVLGIAVFTWALFGILTREAGTLASFWPANAFLLAMLVRFPGLASGYAWPAAFLGYVAADIITGGSLLATGLLTLANLAGVAVGYVLLSQLSEDDRALRQPRSVLFLMLVLASASAASGAVGAFANPILFAGDVLGGFAWWFVTEFVNYVAIVPVILTIPEKLRLSGERRRWRIPRVETVKLLPVVALLLSVVASLLVGGPGALAFPVPALLWCAVTYSLFATSLLTFAFSVWTLLGVASGVLDVPLDEGAKTISLRLGVVLVALAPLMVGSLFDERNRLIGQLRHQAMHDGMTGLTNRATFFDLARDMLAKAGAGQQFAVLMLDLDRFKSINDTFGHGAGDRLLVAFANCLRDCIREKDIYGRIGGEEFAAILPDCGRNETEIVARRILASCAALEIECDLATVRTTVSIGAAIRAEREPFEALLARADQALYRAKQGGRNRIEFSGAAVR